MIHYNYKFKVLYGAEYGAWYGPLKSPFHYNSREDSDIEGIYVCETTTVLTYEEFIAYAEIIESQFIAWDQAEIDYWNAAYEEYCKESDEGCGQNSQDS